MDLIIIKQLPIIEEQLKAVSEQIKQKTEQAISLICTEDSVKQIKSIRAELNKEAKEFEDKRKQVKDQIMKPYNDFEAVYKANVSDQYKKADADLKSKIDAVENHLKAEKETKLREYYLELCETNRIDFVPFERLNLNITLSASEKSLKDDISDFVNRIVSDLSLIETQENKAEIFVEYKQSLNVSQAITSVANRHKAIEKEKAKQLNSREEKEEAPADFFTPQKKFYKVYKITVPLETVEEVEFYLDTNDIKYEEV